MNYRRLITSVLLISICSVIVFFVSGCTEPPFAYFTIDKEQAAVGETIQLISKSSGKITSYSWDFGDGNFSNEQNPSHIYHRDGVYSISLTVTNEAGTDIKRASIEVVASPIAKFSVSPNTINVSDRVTFIDESTGDIDEWLWDFGDGSTSTERNPSYTYLDTEISNYTVSLTVTNFAGSDSSTQKINVIIPPTASISVSETKAKLGLPILFTCDTCMGNDSKFWDFGDGYTSTEENPAHQYIEPGNYSITLTISNSAGSDTIVRENYITIEEPARLDTGTVLLKEVEHGWGQLNFYNETYYDAVVVLCKAYKPEVPLLAVYIQSYDSDHLPRMKSGDYIIYVLLGWDWDVTQKSFLREVRYLKYIGEFDFVETSRVYYVWDVPLYQGDLHSADLGLSFYLEPVDEYEFPAFDEFMP